MARRENARREEPSDDMVLLPRINMPPWLKTEFRFLFLDKKVDRKEYFFQQVLAIHPINSRGYRLIERAYATVEKEFADIRRDDGDDYLDHLVESALIAIAHLHVRKANVIAAILLHDIVEDVEGWTWVRVKREFNKTIATMVRRMTKGKFGEKCRYKTREERDKAYRSQVWNADRDTIIAKLCERLHNTIKIWRTGEDRIRRKLLETEAFYLRLARREHILSLEYKIIIAFIYGRLRA